MSDDIQTVQIDYAEAMEMLWRQSQTIKRLQQENEKLRAAMLGVTSELEQFVHIFKGYQGMTMNNAQAALRAAAAAYRG